VDHHLAGLRPLALGEDDLGQGRARLEFHQLRDLRLGPIQRPLPYLAVPFGDGNLHVTLFRLNVVVTMAA
jgi:hypothetical protein